MNNQSKINLQDSKLQLPAEVFSVKILNFPSGKHGKKSIIPENFVEFLEGVASELKANSETMINKQLNEHLRSEMHLLTSAVAKQSKDPLPGESAGSVGFNWLDRGTLYPVVIPTELRNRFLNAVSTITQETEKQNAKLSKVSSSYYSAESRKRNIEEVAAISQGRGRD